MSKSEKIFWNTSSWFIKAFVKISPKSSGQNREMWLIDVHKVSMDYSDKTTKKM